MQGSLVQAVVAHQAAPACRNPTLIRDTEHLLSGKEASEGKAEPGCALDEGADLVTLWFVQRSSSLVL